MFLLVILGPLSVDSFYLSMSDGFSNIQESTTWTSNWHIKGVDNEFFSKHDLCRGINSMLSQVFPFKGLKAWLSTIKKSLFLNPGYKAHESKESIIYWKYDLSSCEGDCLMQ